MGRYAGGARVWLSLCAAALFTGGSFAILFTGETVDGFDGGFGPLSLVALFGGSAFWVMVLAAFAAVLVGSAGGYRFALLFPATAVYALLAAYGPPPLLPREGWRDLLARWQEWLFQIGADVYAAGNTMYAEPIPYDLEPGLMVVLIPIVMVVVAFATSATLYEGSPVVSVAVLGLTIGVLSTISFEDGAGPFFALFLVSAVALLLFSGGTSPRSAESPQGNPVGRGGLVAGACVVALVLFLPKAPLSDQTVSSGAIDWTRIGTGGTSRLDVQADVGDYLTYGREAELLRVRSPEPLYWRGGTLDYFDGVRWSDTTEPGRDYGEEVSPAVETREVLQSFQVLNAQTDRVFGAYRVVQTSFAFDEVQPNSDGSWTADEQLAEGGYYRVLSEVPQPTEAQLQAAGESYPAEVAQKFLQLPGDRPEVIARTAEQIQDDYDPQTPYERARAIERYLIYDGGFTYNLDVSYRRADEAIEEFLSEDGREGFCTQFATSMALLAREMGLPSRVVYGSTQGEEVDTDEWVVTGANMHTWVELYFPGVGWYPFDPTPGFSVPSAMQANAPRPTFPSQQSGALPSESAELREQELQEEERAPEEEERATEERRDAVSAGGGIPAWPFYTLLPVLLVGAVPLTKRALLARGRPEDLYRDLAGRLRDASSAGGAADSPALTPIERLTLLAGAAGVEEGPFREFAEAYSEHLYAGGPDRRRGRRLPTAHRKALRAYQEGLPRWRRVLGAVNPASLLARAAGGLRAARLAAGKRLRGLRRR